MRHVDRRQRGAEIDGREPAGVAVREHLHRLRRRLLRSDGGDQRGAMFDKLLKFLRAQPQVHFPGHNAIARWILEHVHVDRKSTRLNSSH